MQKTITIVALAEIIVNLIVWHYDLPDFIFSNYNSVFISKS